MLPAILGGLAVGAGGSLFGNLLGRATAGPGFQPSPMMSAFGDYGLSMVNVPKWRKKADRAQFRQYVKSGDRGAGEDFLRTMADMYPSEKIYSKKLKKSLKQPADLGGKAWDVADQIYTNAGLSFTGEEYDDMAKRATKAGIRGSGAFGDFLKQNLMAQGKIMTPQQEMLSYMFGAPRRTESGVYTNDYMWSV